MSQLICLFQRITLLVITSTLLNACGGGGGGTLPSTQRPVVDPITDHIEANNHIIGPPYGSFSEQPEDSDDFDSLVASFETDEYLGMQGLSLINASSAYARGANGAGVTVGVIDSGVYEQHGEFGLGLNNKVSIIGSDYSGASPRTNASIGHGTLVAGIIAANRDNHSQTNFNMHGVAFNARIVAYEIPLQSGDGPYEPVEESDLDFGTDNYFASRFTAMTDEVDIINISFGFPGLVTDYSAETIEQNLGNTIEALRQDSKSLGNRSIFVIAAGNAFGDLDEFGNEINAISPELLPGLPHLFPELQPYMLAVAAVDSSGSIASYSNHCGVAADFCLAAPGGGDTNGDGSLGNGEVIWSANSPPSAADPGSQYYGGSIGTSFAAPLVSGSLALLKQLFPTVGNHELANRLLVTANKAGIYADSSVYGQGLLDLDSATRPVGELSSPTGANLELGMINPTNNMLNIMGEALGDSIEASLKHHDIALFDTLGFPFYQSASTLVSVSAKSIATASTLTHGQQINSHGRKLLLGVAQNPWRRDIRFAGNPNHQVQPDYMAIQFQDEQGDERFAGMNANPGWFFGLYGDSVLSPASTDDDSSFAAPWLRYARQGWSSGGAVPLSANQKVRVGLFNGRASWDRYQPQSDLEADGALIEYSLLSSRAANGHLSSHHLSSRYGLSIQTGFVRELDSFLGTSVGSALGNLGASETVFVGLNGRIQMGRGWQAVGAVYQGTTDTGSLNSQTLAIDPGLNSRSWALGLQGQSVWRANDQFSLYITQPLRVESGQGTIKLATGRTPERQVIYENIPISLQPQGREQQLELGYYLPKQIAHKQAWFSATTQYIRQPNHSPLNPSQVVVKLMFTIATD